jgi:hypothetical protein
VIYNGKSKLEDLNDDLVKTIIYEYYYTDIKVKELIEKYKLPIGPQELVKNFPLQKIDINCPYCKKPMYTKFKARLGSGYESSYHFCLDCRHSDQQYCSCVNCESVRWKKREEAIFEKSTFIQIKLREEKQVPIHISSLSFRDLVFLGAVLRGGISKDYDYIKPIEMFDRDLAPTTDFESIIINSLLSNNILIINEESNLSAFTVDYEENSYDFDRRKVSFFLNIEGDKELIINNILQPEILTHIYTEECQNIWKEILFNEALQLFQFRIKLNNLPYKVGKETINFFQIAVEKLPLKTLYNIIYYNTERSAAFSNKPGITKYIAANSTLRFMRNSYDRIISGQLYVKDYGRPIKECPQSIVSEYFFNSIIKICDKGWEINPCLLKPSSDFPEQVEIDVEEQ